MPTWGQLKVKVKVKVGPKPRKLSRLLLEQKTKGCTSGLHVALCVCVSKLVWGWGEYSSGI